MQAGLTPRIPAYRKVRVLVVDDEEPLRVMLAMSLTALGVTVLTAASGNEAIRTFEAEQPDLVLTDLRMPDGDGLVLLEAIRRRARNTIMVVMTGGGLIAGQEAFTAARLAGAHVVFAKPFDLDDLKREIRRWALVLSYERLGFQPRGGDRRRGADPSRSRG